MKKIFCIIIAAALFLIPSLSLTSGDGESSVKSVTRDVYNWGEYISVGS